MSEEETREQEAAAPPPEPEPEPAEEESVDGSADAVFDALWAKVLESWDDDKPHHALLQHAIDQQKLPRLAGLYRGLKDDPDKGARAQKKMDGVVIAATHMLMATKTPPRTKTPWTWTASAALLFGLVIALILYKLLLGR